MFKIFAALSFLVLTVFVIGLYDYQADANNRGHTQSLKERAVRIEYVCGMTHTALNGSGVVIARNSKTTTVVTAAHVVASIAKKGCDIIVRDWRGHSGYAKILKFHTASDIAVLEVGEPIGKAAPLHSGAYLGQAISCVGWPVIPNSPGVDQMSITRGWVSTVVGRYLRISADIFFGNSGGACFSREGHVVGIVSFFYSTGVNVPFNLPTPRPGQFYISDVANLKILLD